MEYFFDHLARSFATLSSRRDLLRAMLVAPFGRLTTATTSQFQMPAELTASVVDAPDGPASIQTVLATVGVPAAVMYAVVNTGKTSVDSFRVAAFQHDASGNLKALVLLRRAHLLPPGGAAPVRMECALGIERSDRIVLALYEVASGGQAWKRTLSSIRAAIFNGEASSQVAGTVTSVQPQPLDGDGCPAGWCQQERDGTKTTCCNEGLQLIMWNCTASTCSECATCGGRCGG